MVQLCLGCRPVADDVLVHYHRTLLEDGNAGAASKGKVAQLIPLGIGLANLCCELYTAHLPVQHKIINSWSTLMNIVSTLNPLAGLALL